MRRPGKEPEEPLLFDLPLGSHDPDDLDGPGEFDEPPVTRRPRTPPRREPREALQRPIGAASSAPSPLPLSPRGPRGPHGDNAERGVDPLLHGGGHAEETSASASAVDGGVPVGRRFGGALVDLLLHATVVAGLAYGSHTLGAALHGTDWPAGLLFLLPFSFLYTVVPLAFWGQTPGMASVGLLSQNAQGDPLTFDQTARRWVGGLITLAFAGLPLLVSGRRRSVADLLSGSVTVDGRSTA